MGLGDIIGALWGGYKAGSSGSDLYNFGVSLAGLEVAATQIEANQQSYLNNKSDANVKAVKTNIIRIRDYLLTLDADPPSISDIKDLEGLTNYQVSSAISNYAKDLRFKIDMAISSGNLPEIDDRPWSSRRGGYIRLREGSRQMALQFEAVVRNKQRELTEITSYEARLLAIAFSKDITEADYQWIQADMREQQADEGSTRRTLAIFAILANGSRKNYERFSALIEAGDRKNAK